MPEEKKLFLLDAYALIFRSYYAFIKNPRINSKGLNTSAIFGFTNSLNEILQKEKPTHIAVVFDPPTPTFRHKKFPAYKAQRAETPEDIIKSVPYIKQIIEGFNIPVIQIPEFEADDTIGTLAKQAEKEGFTVYMMTPDKDFAQLVSENIFMYKPSRSGKGVEILGIPEVCEKFMIKRPLQVIDILALWGDSSDNIPGAPGVGEKTSKKYISQYGSVEGLLDNLQDVKGKLKEKIENARDQIMLSKELVTIRLDVPVQFEAEKLQMEKPNTKILRMVFDELEFRTLAERILPGQTIQNTPSQGSLFDMEPTAPQEARHELKSIKNTLHAYILADNEEAIQKLVDQLSRTQNFCFDTETTSLNVHNAELVGIAFSYNAGEATYVPIPQDKNKAKARLDLLRSVLEDEKITKTGQNIKYDIQVLQNHGITVKGKLFDTMIAHYLLEPDQRHNMDYLAATYLDYQTVSIEELIGKKGKNQGNMRHVPLEKIKEYAGEDADITWQLYQILKKKLAEAKLTDLFENIEMPLIYVLSTMEINGVHINTETLATYAVKLKEKLQGIEKSIFKHAGIEFNIGSPKQLGEVLFDRMKIVDNPKKTKTKQYATGEQELSKIADKHPIIEDILEYRSVSKLLNTYIESLPDLINKRTGKIHTSFNQAIAATGRLSSNNPNLQNIPIRTEEGSYIRSAFECSHPNSIMLAADYSQIELRLMAHVSGDENMIEAFMQEQDIHAATAAKINKIPLEDVSREMRSQAKSANFGIIYGISSFGLAQNLRISRSDAKLLIDGYFETYPKVKEYMDNQVKLARDREFVETLLGRRRYLRDINSRNYLIRGVAERNAINAPIQGSAADIIKLAMIRIHSEMENQNYQSKMLMQVHDELVFEVENDELESLKVLIIKEMSQAYKLNVPLKVDLGTGKNWLEAH